LLESGIPEVCLKYNETFILGILEIQADVFNIQTHTKKNLIWTLQAAFCVIQETLHHTQKMWNSHNSSLVLNLDGVHAEMPSLLLQGLCKELLHHPNN